MSRSQIYEAVAGSCSVDKLSVGTSVNGNSNTVVNSVGSRILGNANNVTNSSECNLVGGSNLISGSDGSSILGSYGSSIINSPGSLVLGGSYQTINAITGTKTKIPNNYIEFPDCYNLRVNLSGSATTTPSSLTLPASAGVPTGTVDANGVTIPEGSMCWDSVGNKLYVFDGAAWSVLRTGTTEDLATTLAAGNTTGANNIVVQQKLTMPTAAPTTTTNLLNVTTGAGVPTGTSGVNAGSLYYNTSDGKLYVYNGSTWSPSAYVTGADTLSTVLARGNTSGASNIIMGTGQSVQFTGASTGNSIINTVQTGVTNRTISLPNLAADDTFVTLAATQTLLAKTLTSPTINTGTISGGTINNATIGATTATTGRFTTVTATATTNQLILGTTNTTTINATAGAAARTFTIPALTTSDTAVCLAQQQTISNKLFLDTTSFIANTVDNTKQCKFDVSAFATATSRTIVIPSANDTMALIATQQTLSNKNLDDTTVFITNTADPTKKAKFSVAGYAPGQSFTFSLPPTNDTICGINAPQSLAAKTIDSASNLVTTDKLWTAAKTAQVDITTGSAPVVGQALTATSSTVAQWQYPSVPILAVGTSSETAIAVTAAVESAITGDTVTCTVAGTYIFNYTAYYWSSSATAITQFYFSLNGAQVLNSVRKIESDGPSKPEPIAINALIALTAGQIVTVRMTCDTTNTNTVGFRTLIGQRISA